MARMRQRKLRRMNLRWKERMLVKRKGRTLWR